MRWPQNDYYVRTLVEYYEYIQTITYRVMYFDARVLQGIWSWQPAVVYINNVLACAISTVNDLASVRQSTNAANSRINHRSL